MNHTPERPRAAVVGTGFVGAIHVEALRRLGVEVLGVVGSSPERAAEKAAAAGLPAPYESIEAMLADHRVDAVPHHVPEPCASRAGKGHARGGQARDLREAARDEQQGDG